MKKWKLKSQNQMEQQSKNNTNPIVIMVSISVIVIGIFWIITILNNRNVSSGDVEQTKLESSVNNVSIVEGKQVIEIIAKGGYAPQKTIAKAGVPTIIKFKTNGTYDCSSAVRIPSLDISKNLPGSGETEVEIGSQQTGTLAGICSMGMYAFEIDFQS